MTAFVIRRLLQAALVLFVMSLLVFAGLFLIGDPVEMLMGDQATGAERLRLVTNLGLDQPFYVQYFRFFLQALHGDLGRSFIFGDPALHMILERMPATFELAFLALFIAVVLGIPLGVWAGLRPDSLPAKTIMTGSILGFSLPTFWVGIMMIMVFAVQLGWLPATGRGETVKVFGIGISLFTWDGLAHAILPAINLALFKLSLIIRLARAGTSEVVHQDYIKFAQAKGLSNARIIGVHLLKNILIPIVTVLGLEFGHLLAFSTVTETVFSWPGMGKLLIESIRLLDRPVIVAYLMLIVFIFVIVNLIVDILYSALDPRVRLQDAR